MVCQKLKKLTPLCLPFEPYFEIISLNSATMKAKLAFWPTFSFLCWLLLWQSGLQDMIWPSFFHDCSNSNQTKPESKAALATKLTGRLLLREHKVHDFPLNFCIALPVSNTIRIIAKIKAFEIALTNILCSHFN